MERSIAAYEGVAGPPRSGSTREIHLAFLGAPRTAAGTPLHPESPETPSRPRGPITTGNVLRLLACQEYRCALTGRLLTPATASLDHIVPVRCGGEYLIENTQVLHKDVNRAKATMTNEKFIELCREVVEHTAQTKIEGEST